MSCLMSFNSINNDGLRKTSLKYISDMTYKIRPHFSIRTSVNRGIISGFAPRQQSALMVAAPLTQNYNCLGHPLSMLLPLRSYSLLAFYAS